MKKHIPNFITCLNLFAGCVSCVMAFEGSFLYAFFFILLAAVLDFFDGLAARLLKAYSPIGKDLDSLADVISFGFAPGCLIFNALQSLTLECPCGTYISYFAFLIPVFSALRLAKFNIDERQTTSFIGLPVPANAMFWSSAVIGTLEYAHGHELVYIICTIVMVFVFSWLLISEIPMFSLKVKNFSLKDNAIRYILILATILALIFLGWLGIAIGIVLYILLSLFSRKA